MVRAQRKSRGYGQTASARCTRRWPRPKWPGPCGGRGCAGRRRVAPLRPRRGRPFGCDRRRRPYRGADRRDSARRAAAAADALRADALRERDAAGLHWLMLSSWAREGGDRGPAAGGRRPGAAARADAAMEIERIRGGVGSRSGRNRGDGGAGAPRAAGRRGRNCDGSAPPSSAPPTSPPGWAPPGRPRCRLPGHEPAATALSRPAGTSMARTDAAGLP